MTDTNTTITPAAALVASLKKQAWTGQCLEADDAAYFNAYSERLDPAIRFRILIERAVIRQAVKDLIATGLVISVWDGEDYPIKKSNDVAAVMAEIGACDEEKLFVREVKEGGRFPLIGTILLVYGNDGWDVMADNSLTLERDLQPAGILANAICDALAEVF